MHGPTVPERPLQWWFGLGAKPLVTGGAPGHHAQWSDGTASV